MHGSLEPEDRVMDAPSVYEQVSSLSPKNMGGKKVITS